LAGFIEAPPVSPDIAYVTTYPCPRCGAMLEAAVDEWQDWLRCPSCGKASRPPYERRARAEAVDDVLYIGTFTTGPAPTEHVNGSGAVNAMPPWARPTLGLPPYGGGYPGSSGTMKRALIGGGLLLSIVLALVSVAQKNPTQAGVFGFVAFLLIVFLVQSSRQP
jgi:DNA-directed RNA polymerase subunit RPC12/RpoP